MIAYHGKESVKDKYLKRVTMHELADEIKKGFYWEDGKGCAVGCTIHGNNHADYEAELGIPRIIARLEDGIFEGLPNDLAKTWPRRFLEAIRPGADLSLVWPKFASWLLTDETHGIIKFARTDEQREAIQSVSDLYVLRAEGAEIDIEDWLEARAAAAAAAYAAAAAAAAAYAAAYAAAAADADAAAAAYAAAAYAAAAAARQSARVVQSEKLLELLRAAN